MEKLTLKNSDYKTIWFDMINKISEGWKVTKPIYQNWLCNWICKLERPKK